MDKSTTAVDKDVEAASPSRTSINIDSNNEPAEPVSPGKFGSMASYATMIVVMVASVICRRYSSFPVLGDIDAWGSDCPAGYEHECRANQAILRFSFALAIVFTIQLVVTAVYPRFYDTLWIVKWAFLLCLVIGFFYAKPQVFDNHGKALIL